jgi:hypothetical protein
MNPIRLPAAAASIEQLAAGQTVEICQTSEGAIITTAGPRLFCRVVAPPLPDVDAPAVGPIVLEARALVAAAEAVGCGSGAALPGRPLVVVQINAEIVGIVGPTGTPQTIPTSGPSGPMAKKVKKPSTDPHEPPGERLLDPFCTSCPADSEPAVADCSGLIERVQGEAASGMTKQVAVIEPEHLHKLATTAIGMGITAVEVTITPRWDALLAEGRMPDGSEASFGITGIMGPRTIGADREPSVEITSETEADADPLTFFVPETKARRGGAGQKAKPAPAPSGPNLTDLPF